MIYTKEVIIFNKPATVACDGNCAKAWGISRRPKLRVGIDEDDVAWLADDEIAEAPCSIATYEGGFSKPDGPEGKNKWCSRECERSTIVDPGQAIKLRDFSKRVFNQPWKHGRT